jgi:hypothetical protein
MNVTGIPAIDSIQVTFFYYVGVVSVSIGAVKLGIHAIRSIWIESIDVVEDTGELAHLIASDVRQIYSGTDRAHIFAHDKKITDAP